MSDVSGVDERAEPLVLMTRRHREDHDLAPEQSVRVLVYEADDVVNIGRDFWRSGQIGADKAYAGAGFGRAQRQGDLFAGVQPEQAETVDAIAEDVSEPSA